MMGKGGTGRILLALAAGYLLVLQTMLGGLATGAHGAARYSPELAGQVICSGLESGGAQRDGGAPVDPSHHTPDCCMAGCHLAGSAGTPPTPAALRAPLTHARPFRWPDTGHVALGTLIAAYAARGPPLA
ncbi:hypothetical protein MWN34_06665 [Ancylobacter sp. 6x-1]|uniref:DUF2946 domain-containing protein n=1 Tax=Ancylobacter crimeensis TaxID=2579147 RepID=A0ABT0D9L3_9HYPH|nr:DUF2946 family protein [Ancylobacter crimeensis]MCK0196594.1 hypothetical protein [Ancylobacter crimeensis]